MNETVAIEAVRAAGGLTSAQMTQAATPTADPAAVAGFQAAMATPPVTDIPFASQVSAAWRAQQVSYQESLHRVKALSELSRMGGATAGGMIELQYEVASLSFKQEVVTSIAKKASDAVQTLVKNG